MLKCKKKKKNQELQLLQILVTAKKTTTFKQVPVLSLQVIHWNEPIICCHFSCLLVIYEKLCLHGSVFFSMFCAAKITLKEAKNALNTLLRTFSCVDNCRICTKHDLIIDREKPVTGDGLHGNNCL